jgi:hypothetical protein
MGRGPSRSIEYRATGTNVHSFKVDDRAGYIISTLNDGGLRVADLMKNEVLWSLPEVIRTPQIFFKMIMSPLYCRTTVAQMRIANMPMGTLPSIRQAASLNCGVVPLIMILNSYQRNRLRLLHNFKLPSRPPKHTVRHKNMGISSHGRYSNCPISITSELSTQHLQPLLGMRYTSGTSPLEGSRRS